MATKRRSKSAKVPSTRTPVRRRPSIDFSLSGLVFTSMMMFMAMAAINSQTNLLFAVAGLMLGVGLVSFSISRLVLRKLNIKRILPEQAHVGEPVTLTYEFNNTKRFWPSLSVGLHELDGTEAFVLQPFAYMLHAAARQTATVETLVTPKRRGLHQLNRYQVYTSFPFGFIKRAVQRSQPDTILIGPPIGRVNPRVLALLRSADNTGAHVRPRDGGDDEFYGVRDYQSGDNPRRIYWRRSARTGVLVTKEMTQVAPPRLLILVDTMLASRTTEAHASVERSIARAASLAAHALEQDLMVGVYAWNDGWSGVAPARGKRQIRDIMGLLSRLPLNTQHGPSDLMQSAQHLLRGDMTMVLFGPAGTALPYSEVSRGSILAVPDGSGQADAWFQFEKVDFSSIIPPDQDQRLDKKDRRSR